MKSAARAKAEQPAVFRDKVPAIIERRDKIDELSEMSERACLQLQTLRKGVPVLQNEAGE